MRGRGALCFPPRPLRLGPRGALCFPPGPLRLGPRGALCFPHTHPQGCQAGTEGRVATLSRPEGLAP